MPACLDMPTEQEAFFPEAHMFTGFLKDMAEDFEVGASGEYGTAAPKSS